MVCSTGRLKGRLRLPASVPRLHVDLRIDSAASSAVGSQRPRDRVGGCAKTGAGLFDGFRRQGRAQSHRRDGEQNASLAVEDRCGDAIGAADRDRDMACSYREQLNAAREAANGRP